MKAIRIKKIPSGITVSVPYKKAEKVARYVKEGRAEYLDKIKAPKIRTEETTGETVPADKIIIPRIRKMKKKRGEKENS